MTYQIQSPVNSLEIGSFIEGLEIDNSVIAAPQASVTKYEPKVKAFVPDAVDRAVQARYDIPAMIKRYDMNIPTSGITWRNLPNIKQDSCTYAKCTPVPTYNPDGSISKYNKQYSAWDKPLEMISITDDYGVVVPPGYIVVDVDNLLSASILYRYVVDKNIKTMVMQTDKGMHFWFRLPEDVDLAKRKFNNDSNLMTMSTLLVDYRLNGGALSCLRFRGKERLFIYGSEFRLEELDFIPIILYRVVNSGVFRAPSNKLYDLSFLGLRTGSRDNNMYDYKRFLYGTELLDIKETAEVLTFINDYLLADPFTQGELYKFTNPKGYEGIERHDPEKDFFNKSRFLHAKCADYLSKHYNFIPLDRKSFPLIYKDGYYQNDPDGVEMEIRKLVPELTTSQVDQVQRCLHLNAVESARSKGGLFDENGCLIEPRYTINVKNGRLSLDTGIFTEHDPKYIDTQRLPTTYDPSITTCEEVERVLYNVFEGDMEKIALFYEICAVLLIRDNTLMSVSYMFTGEGSNGKSTVIAMMRALIGNGNICCIKPSEMRSDSFNLIGMLHKLACIVEELSSEDINETDIFKQVVTGDMVACKQKFKDTLNIKPYCTVVYAMNKVPNFADKSTGMKRRYIILPFTKNFEDVRNNDASNFDPHIMQKVTTERAKSFLLNKALEAFKGLYERGKHTVPKACEEAKTNYLTDTNPCVQWIEEKDIGIMELTCYSLISNYKKFAEYQTSCLGAQKPWSRSTWVTEVLRYFSKELLPPKRHRPFPSLRNIYPMSFVLKDGVRLSQEDIARLSDAIDVPEELLNLYEEDMNYDKIKKEEIQRELAVS